MPRTSKVWTLDHGVARHDELSVDTQHCAIVSGTNTGRLGLSELREHPPQDAALTQFTYGFAVTFDAVHSPKLP